MNQITKMTNDNFVGISTPIEIRRAILESSKHTINNLQISEDIREIREQKFKLMDEFKEQLSDLRKDLSKLKKKLPLNKLGESAKIVKKAKMDSVKKEKVLDLSDFEKELSLLESQVNSMK